MDYYPPWVGGCGCLSGALLVDGRGVMIAMSAKVILRWRARKQLWHGFIARTAGAWPLKSIYSKEQMEQIAVIAQHSTW